MAITTGGGIAFDRAQQSRENSSRNMNSLLQAAQFAIGSEQQNKQQALEQASQQFVQLSKLAQDSGDPEGFWGSEAGVRGMSAVQIAMSRAAGKNLSSAEAMDGAYVGASRYMANNPSLQSQLNQVARHVVPLLKGGSNGIPPEAPANRSAQAQNKASAPSSPQQSTNVVTGSYESPPSAKAMEDRQNFGVGGLINEINQMRSEFGENPTTEQQVQLNERMTILTNSGLNPEEINNPAISEILRNSPTLTMPEVRAIAIKNYKNLYDSSGRYITQQMKKDTMDSNTWESMEKRGQAWATQSQINAATPAAPVPSSGNIFPSRNDSTQAMGNESPTLSPRRGPGQEQNATPLSPRSPFDFGVQNVGSELSKFPIPEAKTGSTPLPATVPTTPPSTRTPRVESQQAADAQTASLQEASKGIVPLVVSSGLSATAPEIRKAATDVAIAAERMVARTVEDFKNKPMMAKKDAYQGESTKLLHQALQGAFEKINQNIPMSREERTNLAIANRDFRTLSEKLDEMPDSESRALYDRYKNFYENASISELGAAGLGDMADRKLTQWVTNAQATAAYMRTKAEAGSSHYQALVDLQKTAMDSLSKAEGNVAEIMKSEKIDRSKVASKYPEMFKTIELLTGMVFGQQVDLQLLRKRNLSELVDGVPKGAGTGEAYGTNFNIPGQNPGQAGDKPLTDSQINDMLKKLGYE